MGKVWRVTSNLWRVDKQGPRARGQSRGREVKRWKDEVTEIMDAKRLKCRRGVFVTAGSGRWSLACCLKSFDTRGGWQAEAGQGR